MIFVNPAISIVVPVYEAEKYINRCIDSILAQIFTDFELILVDDGSTDNSGKICDEYAAKDSRVRVIHKFNGGVSSARNAALDIAAGEYIMFCDSDDYVDKQWCQQMYAVIHHYPDAWINCNIYDDWEGDIKLRVHVSNDAQLYEKSTFFAIDKRSLSGALWNKIYSNGIIRSHFLRFNENYKIGEDVNFNVHYYQYCTSSIWVSKALYYYCYNGSSLTHKYTSDNFNNYRTIFSDRLACIESEHLGDYLDNWLWRFVKMLDEVHDPRNSMSFVKRMAYCQEMMNTEEFRYCVSNAPGKSESPLYMKAVRTHNYYLFWVFQKVCHLKAMLKKQIN